MRTGRAGGALALIGVLFVGAAERALAQAGAGAQRYEVTITPPKRGGTSEAPAAALPGLGEAAPQDAGDHAATDAAGSAGADDAADDAANSASVEVELGGATPAPDASEEGRAAVAAAPAPSEPVAATAGPPHSLQVGAFRRERSAEDFQRTLAATFPDVVVVEVLSGGEPLYRIHVGRAPRGPQLEALKRDLLAAGHASFEVPAPPID